MLHGIPRLRAGWRSLSFVSRRNRNTSRIVRIGILSRGTSSLRSEFRNPELRVQSSTSSRRSGGTQRPVVVPQTFFMIALALTLGKPGALNLQQGVAIAARNIATHGQEVPREQWISVHLHSASTQPMAQPSKKYQQLLEGISGNSVQEVPGVGEGRTARMWTNVAKPSTDKSDKSR